MGRIIKKIAVIGAGLMGHGIAQEFSTAGYEVALNDVSNQRLGLALGNVRENLGGLGFAKEDVNRIAARIQTSTDLPIVLLDADLVVEAVSEDLEVKRIVFTKIDQLVPTHSIIASNTSSFMPSQLASVTGRPGQVLVTHYFNPPYLVPLVEIVRSSDTTDETITSVTTLLKGIGKYPVVLKREVPGFIANRLQAALLRECFALVEDGVAEPQDIDDVMTHSLGRRLAVAGPFEIFDAAGLDVWKAIASQLMPVIESSPDLPALLTDLTRRGDFGIKTGKGVHTWSCQESKDLRNRLTSALTAIQRWTEQ